MEKFNKSKVSRLTGETVVIFSNKEDFFRVTATPAGVELEGKIEFESTADMAEMAQAIGLAWDEWQRIRRKLITLESMNVSSEQVLK